MGRYLKDTGLVLAKKDFLIEGRLITIFTRNYGKIVLFAYGTQKITSKRIAHLETGNYITFSFYKRLGAYYLSETELLYGHSQIKKTPAKLTLLFLLFFILHNILAEGEKEEKIFDITLSALKDLNNNISFTMYHLSLYLSHILMVSGFLDQETAQESSFDVLHFIEDLVGRRIKDRISFD